MSKTVRSKSIKIRVTPEELLLLQEKAAGQPLASFMREFCIHSKFPKRRHPPKIDPEFMRKFAGICNNLNQIAREVNSRHDRYNVMAVTQSINLFLHDLRTLKADVNNFQ